MVLRQLKTIVWRLGFVSLSLMASLALGEAFVRIFAARKPIYNIEMVKYATQLKTDHPNPHLSHVHRKNASAELMGVQLILNSFGHRGPEITAERKPGVRRILVLGSSVTMGWGVEQDEVFTSVVQKRLNDKASQGRGMPVEILNAGIGNYNTEQQFALFEEQVPTLNPDMVVLHYFINDAEATEKEKNHPIFRYSYLATFLYDWFEATKYSLDDSKSLSGYYDALYEPSNKDWQHTQKWVGQMQKSLNAKGVKFLVMIVPDFHNLAENSPYQKIYQTIESNFKAKGIPTMNLFPVFQEKYGHQEEALWIQADDPHPNAKGHLLMADMLTRYLNKHPL